MTRTRDLYHEQSEEELLMSLMNEGWTREYAERQIAYRKEQAFWAGQDVVDAYFPDPSPKEMTPS